MEHDELEERILLIRRRDRRFDRNAYLWALDLVDFGLERIRSKPGAKQAHLSATSLLGFVGEFAAKDFGRGASLVFEAWNIRLTDDVGEIIWNLIDNKLLSAGPNDSRYGFQTQVAIKDLLLPPPEIVDLAPLKSFNEG